MYPGLEEKELASFELARMDTWTEMYRGLEEKELAPYAPARTDTWAEMYPGLEERTSSSWTCKDGYLNRDISYSLEEKELAPLEPARTDTWADMYPGLEVKKLAPPSLDGYLSWDVSWFRRERTSSSWTCKDGYTIFIALSSVLQASRDILQNKYQLF